MAYRYHGRARVNPTAPEAAGICQRCGFKYSLRDLVGQREWRGSRIMDIRVRVCRICTDVPNNWSRTTIYPPDPAPILGALPENYTIANNGSPFAPPLPWPIQPSGPAIPGPYYLTDDDGNILYDDHGHPLVADNSPPQPPPFPVYVTPAQPPLPSDIEEGGFSEP